MDYNKLRNKTQKFLKGGKIPKYDKGNMIQQIMKYKGVSEQNATDLYSLFVTIENDPDLEDALMQSILDTTDISGLTGDVSVSLSQKLIEDGNGITADKDARRAKIKDGFNNLAGGLGYSAATASNGFEISAGGMMAMDMGVKAMNAVDSLAMGDKNFGAQSEAVDSAVHGVSGALMKSGNPYAAIAAVAIEGANFMTKAGGETVQGFDVDINSSGYGQMGHMASSSSRDWGAAIGLGGLFGKGKMKAKLAKRNAQARMALEAAEVADTQRFELEARMDSIQNTVLNNQVALAGGVELNSLGA